MSSSLATGPSAELIRYTHGSTRIGRTCTPCVTPMFPATRGSAHRPRTARIGCLACTHGNSSASNCSWPRRAQLVQAVLCADMVEARRACGHAGPYRSAGGRLVGEGDDAARRWGCAEKLQLERLAVATASSSPAD